MRDCGKTTGLSDLIDEVAAWDGEKQKPDPSQVYWLMERMRVGSNSAVMVGDHPIDSLWAKNAGIGFIGVLTGSFATIPSPSDMLGTSAMQ